MSTVKKLIETIQEKRASAEELIEQIERCKLAMSTADRHNGALEDLRDQRKKVVAEGFIAGKEADVSELDRLISDLATASKNARDDGEAAATAMQLLQDRLAKENQEISALVDTLNMSVASQLMGQFERAEAKYGAAIEAVRDALAEMTAVAGLLALPRFGNRSSFGATVDFYWLSLRERGLVVRNGGNQLTTPTWLMRRDLLGGETKRAELIAQLQDVGIELR